MSIVARGLLSRSDWPVIKQQDAVVVLHYRLYSLVILHPPPEIFLGPTLLAVTYRLDRNIDNGYTDANIFFSIRLRPLQAAPQLCRCGTLNTALTTRHTCRCIIIFDDLEWPLTRVSRSLYTYNSNIWKRCVLGTKLLKNTNRKPYTIYRMITLSMTLSHLWPDFKVATFFDIEYLRNNTR